MGRAPREQSPDDCFHVFTRGNNRQPIYFGNWSGRLFVRELDRTTRRNDWRVFAYCLMKNHFHLVVQIGERGLSRGMCELNGRFARITNRRTGTMNHLFGSRFGSRPIEDDDDFLGVCRYVLLNPLRAATGCRDPERWRWSSYAPTMGLTHAPACLDSGGLLERFARKPHRARAAFASFIAAGIDPSWPGAK